MTPATSGKAASDVRPRVVAVLASSTALHAATRLRRLPDLFELRLDALCKEIARAEQVVPRLRAPLIVTARHPAEGGCNDLSPSQRRDLLLRFLPHAAFVDVELRSTRALALVLAEAERLGLQRIISVHDFRSTPSLRHFRDLANRATAVGADILKLATRVDTSADLARLLDAFDMLRPIVPVSAMGIGKLGRAARLELLARGSTLNYAALGEANADGQLTFEELRRRCR